MRGRSVPNTVILFAALVIAVPLACAPVTTVRKPESSPLLDELRRDMAKYDAVSWSETRRLAWRDFQGVAPTGNSDQGAETAYSLFHGLRCTGAAFDFRVVAAVLPKQSWVRPAVVDNAAQSGRTLRHEQTHFDLTEVHARRMRRYFADLYQPCMKSEAELSAPSDRMIKEEAAAQHRYDSETNHGRLAARQATWDADVARQIASLTKFAR